MGAAAGTYNSSTNKFFSSINVSNVIVELMVIIMMVVIESKNSTIAINIGWFQLVDLVSQKMAGAQY